jgi:hypothetical protein
MFTSFTHTKNITIHKYSFIHKYADYSLIQLEIDSRMTENINTRNHKTILLCLKHLTVISGPEVWYLCTDTKHRLYFETETT